MKKLYIFALVASLALGMTGCGVKEALEDKFADGTYRAEYSDLDSHGWKDFVELTVKDGEIVEVDFDSVDENGGLKTEADWYQGAMEPVSGTYPGKFFPELEASLLESQDLFTIDTIAGATSTSVAVKELCAALENNMYDGNTETVIIEVEAEEESDAEATE